MNVFEVKRGIRKVGLNYGLPVVYIDFGFGMRLDIEGLYSKIQSVGVNRGTWLVMRNGIGEKGIKVLTEGMRKAGLKVEVEARSSDLTPTWLTLPDRWLVWWEGIDKFNLTALRKGQDLVVSEADGLDSLLKKYGEQDIVDKGVLLTGQVNFNTVFRYKIRIYKKEADWC